MPMTSLLYINDVPIECINQASISYHVPAELIIAVLKTENGRKGLAKANSNGTFDYGPMQINTIWVNRLQRYGYTKEMLQYNPCINAWVGTWILGQKIASTPNFWRGVAAYHSYTVSENIPYQTKVWKNYNLLHNFLKN
jgi:hypothetical protein